MKDPFAQRPGEPDLEYAYRMYQWNQHVRTVCFWLAALMVMAITICGAIVVSRSMG